MRVAALFGRIVAGRSCVAQPATIDEPQAIAWHPARRLLPYANYFCVFWLVDARRSLARKTSSAETDSTA
jgi:hypothetical protein